MKETGRNPENFTGDAMAADVVLSEGMASFVSRTDESPWLGLLIQWLGTLLLLLAGLMAYHYFYAAKTSRIGVIDINEVLQLKQMQVTLRATKVGADSAAETYEEIAQFARQIEKVIADLQAECECSLFVKAAVIRPTVGEDMTPVLKQRLGIAHLDKNSLIEQLRLSGIRNEAKPLLKEQQK